MSYKYCSNCGHKNQYIGMVPKFCNNCGANMSGVSTSQELSKSTVLKNKNVNKSSQEDETDINFVPRINKLDYEVSAMEKRTFKMEEIFPKIKDGEKE